MITRYGYADLPAEWLRARIAEWLRFHGINPDLVGVPGWIEIDHDRYAVRAQVHRVAPDGIGRIYNQREVVESRNEAEPLPWPTTAAEWLAGPGFNIISYRVP
jgi:hypothetical protein